MLASSDDGQCDVRLLTLEDLDFPKADGGEKAQGGENVQYNRDPRPD